MAHTGGWRWRALLCCALAWAVALNGATSLQLKVVEGEGAEYRPGTKATRGVTVLVTDEGGKPVANAVVSFRLPETGPSGVFNSGLRSEIVTTDADGRATVSGMQWNSSPGPVSLRITAMKDQARAGIISTQKLSESGAVREDVPTKPEALTGNFEVVPAKGAAEKFTTAPVKIAPVPPKNEVTLAKAEVAPASAEPAPAKAEELAPKSPSAGGEGTFTASHGGYGKWILIGVIVMGGAAAGRPRRWRHDQSKQGRKSSDSTARGRMVRQPGSQWQGSRC